MSTRKKPQHFRPGKLKPLVERVAVYAAKNAEHILAMARDGDFGHLHAVIGANDQGYGRKDECYNCGAGMHLNIYTLDVEMCLLLRRMAVEVDRELKNGTPFTQANLVHVMRLETTDAVRHAVTRARYLGLVAQNPKAKHTGYWVITRWGWRLLSGGAVSKHATYWRRQLLERSTEMTTMAEAMNTHLESEKRALARGKVLKNDYRADIAAWNPEEWTGMGGYASEYIDAPTVPELARP
ncbi:MAG: hypothetical protein KGI03_00810 [Patescibacteria group bacterium]|nr:hypothetical protein [Patescibacteria group bacterium]